MALIPISIKFETNQREWLQAEANRQSKGRISTLVKAFVDEKMQQPNKKRAKPLTK